MKVLTLGESLEVLMDHRGKTPKKLGTDFVPSGIPVASAMLVRNGVLDLSAARFVSAETHDRWMSTPTRKGDVLLTSEAPLGRVARLSTDEPVVLGQRLYGLRGKEGVLHSAYLYYALQTELVQADLRGRATGTTVVGIRQSALRQVRIPAPDYDSQRKIARVLAALDDKIAAGTILAATADDLSRSIFSEAIKSAEYSGATFADVARVSGGGTPSTRALEYWGGDVSWATPTDITALLGPYLESTSRSITPAGLAACSSELYSPGAILMTSRATIGAFAVAQIHTAVNQGFIVVEPHDPSLRYWIFHEMRSRVEEFIAMANGATFLELSRGNFKKFQVRLLDSVAMREFATKAEALHASARQALQENRILSELRDALLPELMSGRLRVKDAEKKIEEVV